MKKFFCFLFIIINLLLPTVSYAEDSPSDIEKEINELKSKIEEAQSKERSLTSEIKSMDNRINLTTLQISQTENKIKKLGEEIGDLGTKIGTLEGTLSKLSELLLNRIVTSYKIHQISYFGLLFSSNGFTDLINRTKYIQAAQTHDREVLTEVQITKDTYAQQKELREKKKTEQEELILKLEVQKKQLAEQKLIKDNLLKVTKNDEKKYQQLLAEAQAELEAIQAITAGNGEETEIGKVTEGQKIASMIQGESCNSKGTHLHFIVRQGSFTKDPFQYLKSGIDYENCSGSSCGSGNGDSFSPSGSWSWPINSPVSLYQGYGATWAVHNTWVSQIYNFHNGIDIGSSSLEVKAVKAGVLFRGSYTGSKGCRLRYVRVDHDDSDLDTLYLHINYVL